MPAPIPVCPPGDPGDNCLPVQLAVLCDDNGAFLRRFTFDCDDGEVTGFEDLTLAGAGYVPVGGVGSCDGAGTTLLQRELCDLGGGSVGFIRFEVRDPDGVLVSSFDTEPDGVTPYVPVGPVLDECPCDDLLLLGRRTHFDGTVVWVWDISGGGLLEPVGPVRLVTIKVRALSAPGSITMLDAAGIVTPMFVGDEETWGSGEDPLVGPLTFTGGAVGDVATILWTEEAP